MGIFKGVNFDERPGQAQCAHEKHKWSKAMDLASGLVEWICACGARRW